MIQNLIKATNKIKEVIKKASDMADVPIEYVNVGIAGKHIKVLAPTIHIGLQNNENEPVEINSSHIRKLEKMSKISVIPTNHKIIHSMHQKFTIDEDHESVDPVGEFGKN